MMTGINLAGCYVSLIAACRDNTFSVKLILKDLPLHEVSNQDTLAELKKHIKVLSDVKYNNVYVDSKCTHPHNGDRFVYVPLDLP